MIIYHQAYDANHCVFRMLSIFETFKERSFRLEEIRILDFFLLFPSEIRNARIPTSIKSLAPNLRNTRYNTIPNRFRIFYQLHPIQNAALGHLHKAGYVTLEQKDDATSYRRSEKAIPTSLEQRIESSKTMANVRPILEKYLLAIPLTGSGGLKSRSRLYNVTYDAV